MKVATYIFLSHTLLCAAVASPLQATPASFSGRVVDAATSKPVPYATIYVHRLLLGAAADANGRFSVAVSDGGSYRITVSYLGYRPQDTVATAGQNAELVVSLQPRSLALDEVVVWATETSKNPSTSTIGKAALVHVQPSSFADVMQLLPGHLIKDPKMEEANFITMRQAGSDVNTSLGTAFLVDGAPLNEDATMQNLHKVPNGDPILSRTTTSKGVDMRRISTDRIEQVEVVRGIPSAEYGNLTAGLVKIETKAGSTPWESRAKIDLTNKLFSVGKGFLLPKEGGTLNVDGDYLYYLPDPRNVLTSYRRATFSSRYQNKLKAGDNAAFHLKAGLYYTGSFDDEKKDPEILQGEEKFSTTYHNVMLSTTGALKIHRGIPSELEYTASASYTSDELNRTRVAVGGNAPLPSATSEGEHYAEYLPAVYTSQLKVDDRPLSLSADVKARINPTLGKLRQRLLLGAEWRYNANAGRGEIYDLSRPPYPNSATSTRPRPYSAVPAMQKLALFAEDNATLALGSWRANLRLGLRATTLPGLRETFDMATRWYAEPRVTAAIYLPSFTLFGRKSILSLNAGYGMHYKFPTQAQLYPDNVYFDYIQLNYFSQQESLRTLHVQTWIEDPTPHGLQPVLNVKYEAGAHLEAGDAELSVTLFDEQMSNGFAPLTTFVVHTFKDYDEEAVPPGSLAAAPVVEDFPFVNDLIMSGYTSAHNCSEVRKRGVEYQLLLGRIKALYTGIRLTGAWLHSAYHTGGTRYRKPSVIINNRQYPYTGLYSWNNNDKIQQQLNTNLYLETHIPTLQMAITTSVQAVWLVRTDMYRNNGLPTGYLDNQGQYFEFTEDDAQKPIMKHLMEIYNAHYFDPNKVPLEASLNLRLTKEIGRALRISFYVNRLLSYHPDYTSRYGTTMVRTSKPSFGAEVSILI
ncbi:MAG: carboxypeptidase-like regulatory domain-containing protein [Prevotellaceae bacterium]|nr:carboxypeptidase-like regulatory domain-containing protein [Prevotellaceae bacterium]